MKHLEDLELVKRLQDNHVPAFDELYHRYHQVIYKNIIKLTKAEDVAMDILQDVFAALWEKRLSLDLNKPVSGWLFVVSFNHSINYLKKELKINTYRQSLVPADEMVEQEPEDFKLTEIKYQLLEDAMQQLSPKKLQVFTLCKLQGKSYEKAAEEMNISKHTVKEYLSQAMASIKEFIQDNPGLTETSVLLLFLQQIQ